MRSNSIDNLDKIISTMHNLSSKHLRINGQFPSTKSEFAYHNAFRSFKTFVQNYSDHCIDIINIIGNAHCNEKRFQPISLSNNPHAKKDTSQDIIRKSLQLVDMLLEDFDGIKDHLDGYRMSNTEQASVTIGASLHKEVSEGHTLQDISNIGTAYGIILANKIRLRSKQMNFSIAEALKHQFFFDDKIDTSLFVEHSLHILYPLNNSETSSYKIDNQINKFVLLPQTDDQFYYEELFNHTQKLIPLLSTIRPETEELFSDITANDVVFVETPFQLDQCIFDILSLLPLKLQPLIFTEFPSNSSVTFIELAVDLEHHSEHSYFGYTCLMQLSTQNKRLHY